MPEFKIVLDKSKPYSENHGDVAPDDPHYRVKWWQGQLVGRDMILLPFDSAGDLVPDDGRTASYMGQLDGKPIQYHPLYTKAMRDLVERKIKRAEAISIAPAEADEPEEEDDISARSDEVNFVSWLKGDVDYDWALLQTAGKKRYAQFWSNKKQMVTDLVLDHKVVHDSDLARSMVKYLPARAA